MHYGLRRLRLAMLAWLGAALPLLVATSVRADFDVTGAFGPNGQGGPGNAVGQIITFGSTGAGFVSDIDGFLNIAGQNISAGTPGTSLLLSQGNPPAGLDFNFSAAVNGPQLTLTYQFHNSTASTNFAGVQFFSFVDADIATFFNNYGTVAGSPGPGIPNPNPNSWQIDEPGFTTGLIVHNMENGFLDNTNHVPQSIPNDTSLGLGFLLGTIHPNQTAIITILLSDNGSSVGSLALSQFSADDGVPDSLTMSGQASLVPEPGSIALFGLGAVGLLLGRRRLFTRRGRATA